MQYVHCRLGLRDGAVKVDLGLGRLALNEQTGRDRSARRDENVLGGSVRCRTNLVTGTSTPAYPELEMVTETSQFPACTALGKTLSTVRSGNPRSASIQSVKSHWRLCPGDWDLSAA